MTKAEFKKIHSKASNMSELARLLKCTRQTAYRWCERFGCKLKVGVPGSEPRYTDAQMRNAWKRAGGNIAEASRILGCTYVTALTRIKKLGLKPKGKAGVTIQSKVYGDFKFLVTVQDIASKYSIDSRTAKQMLMSEYKKHPLPGGNVKNVRDIKLAKAIDDDPSILEEAQTRSVKRLHDLTGIQKPWIVRYLKRRGTE